MLMRPHDGESTTCSNCIFDQPWWLNAAAPGQWEEVRLQRGKETVGRWPYVIQKRYGMTVLTMPPYTQVLGPWIARTNSKYEKRLAREKELLTELMQLLPRFDYFSQCFHDSIDNWLPFYWRKWRQTTRYTYVIRNPASEEQVWSELGADTRRDIKRAEKALQVEADADLEEVLRLQELSYQRQLRRTAPATDALRRIGQACAERQAGSALLARDERGRPHAGIFVVWDEKRVYYLVGGGDPELRKSGANSLLLWKAIQTATQRKLSFDFEGSMVEPIERFFRSFGAQQTPYSKVTKANSRLARAAVAFREILRN